MRPLHTSNRLLAWLTALVLLASALAPTLSRWLALQRADPLPTLEVCASRPGHPSQILRRQAPATPAPAHQLDHCPLCALQANLPFLPPTPLPVVSALSLPRTRPAPSRALPRTPTPWAAAQARAPPSLA